MNAPTPSASTGAALTPDAPAPTTPTPTTEPAALDHSARVTWSLIAEPSDAVAKIGRAHV